MYVGDRDKASRRTSLSLGDDMTAVGAGGWDVDYIDILTACFRSSMTEHRRFGLHVSDLDYIIIADSISLFLRWKTD